MTDVHANPETLHSWGSRLSRASEELAEAGHDAPEPPNTGRCTAVVAVGLTQVCEALSAVTNGMNAAGQAVAAGGATYDQSDADGAEDFGSVGGN